MEYNIHPTKVEAGGRRVAGRRITWVWFGLAVLGSGTNAASGGLVIGGHKYMPSAERMGIDASAPSGYFRFSDESAFPLPGSDRLQVTASRISIAYFRDAQGKYVSVNAAALYWAFLIGISDVDPRGESFLGYDGFGLYSTIPFLPQLLTNWSVRYDLVRKHLGIQVGPTTEYLAGKRDFRVLSQLHGGAYAAIFGIEVGGSMAYDPFRNEERFCMSAYKEFL